MGTLEHAAEFFQTMAARDPESFVVQSVFFLEQYRFGIVCTAPVSFDDATAFEARFLRTCMAPEGCVSTAASPSARGRTLRVRDSLAL